MIDTSDLLEIANDDDARLTFTQKDTLRQAVDEIERLRAVMLEVANALDGQASNSECYGVFVLQRWMKDASAELRAAAGAKEGE